jgi:3-oxoacyl-[acyl-carrier-protein] synthase-1
MTSGAMLSGEAVVVGVGARVAAGLDALQVAMTVRAGKTIVRESRFVDRAGAPIALAWVASIADDVVGRDRLAELAAPALAEATRSWARSFESRGHATPPLPLLLGLPAYADPLDSRGVKLMSAIAERARVPLDLARSKAFAQGRAAGVSAVQAAVERVLRGDDEAILVGGVDTHFDPDRLEELDRDRRLHGPSCENGFIPGEGAAFVLVMAKRRAGDRQRFAQIVGVGTEREPRPFGSPEPCHALGITLALERAPAPAGRAAVGWALTDVVHERHRVEEWLFAAGRLHASLAPELRHDQPLLVTGDLGAASAPLMMVLACMAWSTGSAPAPSAIVAAHSDEAERGAILLSAEAPR